MLFRVIAGATLARTIKIVSTNFLPSPVPSDANLDPGEMPFTAFGQFGFGALDLRVFDQATWWVDRSGSPHLLVEMPAEYRRNIVVFLRKWSANFHAAIVRRAALDSLGSMLHGEPNGELLMLGVAGVWVGDFDPEIWLESTPLLRRLVELDT